MKAKIKHLSLLMSILSYPISAIAVPLDSKDESIPVKIVTAAAHTCILTVNGKIKCWGDNTLGQLGIGTTENHGNAPGTMGSNLSFVDLGANQKAKDVCGGLYHTCALTDQHQIKCWGANLLGQLGQGRHSPAVGTLPGQMGDNLPAVSLGDGFVPTRLMCGGNFSCVLNAAGKAKCWGYGGQGQFGVRLYGASEEENSIGLAPEQMGNNLPYLPIKTPISQMGLGESHGCAVTNNKITCWGLNSQGQIGVETATRIIYLPTPQTSDPLRETKVAGPGDSITIKSLYVGPKSNCVQYSVESSKNKIAAPFKLKCWGYNANGELGLGIPAFTVGDARDSMDKNLPTVDIGLDEVEGLALHENFTCAKAKESQMKCWGGNANGELGLGDQLPRGCSPNDMGSKLPILNLGLPVIAISTGMSSYFSCAILLNHGIKCWGYGGAGALGYQDDLSRGGSMSDIGDQLPFVNFK